MSKPIFSFVMPTKDRSSFLPLSVGSILEQTDPNWELVVVDDHSTDNTKQVVESFQDDRIRYVALEEGTGPGAGRHAGILASRGDVIVLADSDDINRSDRLTKIRDALESHPDVALVYSLLERQEEDGSRTMRPGHRFQPELLRIYNYIPNATIAYYREAYLATGGYDPSIYTSEDYDLSLTLLEKGHRFLLVREPLVSQIVHPESTTLSTDYAIRRRNLAYVRRKHGLPLPTFEDAKAIVIDREVLKFLSTPHNQEFWFSEMRTN